MSLKVVVECVLKAYIARLSRRVWRRFVRADHVRFHSCRPYIERLPTL